MDRLCSLIYPSCINECAEHAKCMQSVFCLDNNLPDCAEEECGEDVPDICMDECFAYAPCFLWDSRVLERLGPRPPPPPSSRPFPPPPPPPPSPPPLSSPSFPPPSLPTLPPPGPAYPPPSSPLVEGGGGAAVVVVVVMGMSLVGLGGYASRRYIHWRPCVWGDGLARPIVHHQRSVVTPYVAGTTSAAATMHSTV